MHKTLKKFFNTFSLSYRYHNYILDLEKQIYYLLKSHQEVPAIVAAPNSFSEFNDFLAHSVDENTVLVVEQNNWHGDSLLSATKMFLDLGYNVDVLSTVPVIVNEHVFGTFRHEKLHFWPLTTSDIIEIVQSDFVTKYHTVYFNSREFGNDTGLRFFENIDVYPLPPEKYITSCHFPADVTKKISSQTHATMLLDDPRFQNTPLHVVTPLYPFDVPMHHKNKDITHFVVVGETTKDRRNFGALIDAVASLSGENFIIDVVGTHTEHDIPDSLLHRFHFWDRLSYPRMYHTVMNADYLLTLLDPESQEHERYLTNGITGSYLLTFGLHTPCLIPDKFATHYHLDDSNSLVIKRNESLAQVMQKAIDLDKKSYDILSDNLKTKAEKIKKSNLKTLKELLES